MTVSRSGSRCEGDDSMHIRRPPTVTPRAIGRAALLPLILLGCAPPATPADPLAGAITVMSYNVRYATANDGADAWPARRTILFDVVRRHVPDLLAVQEALRGPLEELEREVPGYTRIGVGRDDGREAGEYAAILYRTSRFAALDAGTFWFSDSPDVPGSMTWGNRVTRICTWARLRDRATQGTFYVYNIHLDHESQRSRELSAALLARRIGARSPADPVLVTGDFNSGEDNPALRLLLGGDPLPGAGRPPGLGDSYRRVHPGDTIVGTFNGFRGDSTGEKIDHILVSADWAVHAASIDRTSRGGRYPSDHFPVTAIVRLVTRR